MKRRLLEVARKTLSMIHNEWPFIFPMIETELQKARGVGWGSESTAHEVQMAAKFLKTEFKNLVCIDVGANCGMYTKNLIQIFPDANVVVVEPQPELCDELALIFESNSKVKVVQSCIGAVESEVSLWFDKARSPLASTLQHRVLPSDIQFSKSISCPQTTIDKLCHSLNILPSLIKIDVEGSELDVLRGAVETIRDCCPVIQFEFGGTQIEARVFFKDFWLFFDDLAYDIYRIGPQNVEQITEWSETQEVFRCTNFLATPRAETAASELK